MNRKFNNLNVCFKLEKMCVLWDLLKWQDENASNELSIEIDNYYALVLGYLKDSNAAAHSADTDNS